ncbi:GNAT family N-acetyltransferase [Oceanobacillus manasiensis]|uniref:GNAT family N-acetyltransferase n=1 Tax=Oceanobacillus manasiensis TaxID=586413 RepID=UPI0005AA64BC|nr:GNAT family N-acetyltransferase [Oceanobacillus manasiensis]
MQIVEVKDIATYQEELATLFQKVVAEGAALNYLHPMQYNIAINYWKDVVSEQVRLFICLLDGKVVGTIQLHLADKENGQHRAEMAKLMTDPDTRRKGVARKLLQHAEQAAKQEKRSLILLDTAKGSSANILYQSEGYILFGQVPAYSQDAFGNYKDNNFYYKEI